MSAMHHFRQGIEEMWDSLREGWQYLYRKAAGAITRFTPGDRDSASGGSSELVERSVGWGVLAAEVFDDDDKVVVRIETPGMHRDEFDLEVMDDYLSISGEKRLQRERTRGRYHITECAYGRFERIVPLPAEVDPAKARADYTDGVLRVEMPKTSASRRRSIKVAVK